MKKRERLIAGLDIGTTKVCVVIASERAEDAALEIIGVGTQESTGMRKGVVVNIDATVDAIIKAKEEAELMSGVRISHVWAGVAGSHIKSFSSKGMVAIRQKEVGPEDVKRVLEAARAVSINGDREVLHVLPQSFSIDDQDGIMQPIGMSGVRLEATVHIITGLKTALHNIVKCAEKAGLQVQGMVLESLASAQAVLSQEEKQLGAALVDMGGGTCDILCYNQGSEVYTSVLPIGGAHLTNDVAVGLRTPPQEAEEIKRVYGCALTSLVDPEEVIEVPSVGGRSPRTISRVALCEVIEARIEETLTLINNEIFKSGYQKLLGSGVVLTGGASQLEGLTELAEFIFDMPVRRACPTNVQGLTDAVKNSSFATAVGLLQYGSAADKSDKNADAFGFGNSLFSNFGNKLKKFIDQAF